MKPILVNVVGGNAVGKTTRFTILRNWLKEEAILIEKFEFGEVYNYKGKLIILLGKEARNGKFVGWDSLGINKLKDRIELIEKLVELYNPFVIVCEGYFNNLPSSLSPDKFKKELDFFILAILYSCEEEMKKRMKERSASSGRFGFEKRWEFNEAIRKNLERLEKQNKDIRIEKISYDYPEDYLITLIKKLMKGVE